MKIVVIGGSGLIGSKLVNELRKRGHDVVAASPNTGVNTITREGLAEALAGAQVVVDVANSPSLEDKAALDFFETSGRNLLPAEAAAGVRHHVALSVVGTDRLQGSGYFRAKAAQEKLVERSAIPYTIVHSTQFFEFMGGIAQTGSVGQAVRVSPALVQPIASDDVVAVMVEVALSAPINRTVEVAGPEQFRLADVVQLYLKGINDPRQVTADEHALYFGIALNDQSLLPGKGARIGAIRFQSWLDRQRKAA
jgi:uncharacterized protein YbjT (DUF2867 family)